jgi:hypothetical protein
LNCQHELFVSQKREVVDKTSVGFERVEHFGCVGLSAPESTVSATAVLLWRALGRVRFRVVDADSCV